MNNPDQSTESQVASSSASGGYLSAVEVHDPASQQSASLERGDSKAEAEGQYKICACGNEIVLADGSDECAVCYMKRKGTWVDAFPRGLGGILDTVQLGDNVAVLSTLPSECIDLVVTSPPYDDLRTYGGHSWDFDAVARDLTRTLKPGGVIVWVVADKTEDGSESGTSMRQALHFMDVCGLRLHDTMIYASDKPPLTHNRYEQAWEYAFVLSKGRPKAWNPITKKTLHGGKANTSRKYWRDSENLGVMNKPGTYNAESLLPNIWWYSTGNDKPGHPAPFPLALAKDHVASWSNPGDVVLDPFAGSGTTLKAAKELNRHWLGIEINPAYVEICNARLAQDVLQLDGCKHHWVLEHDASGNESWHRCVKCGATP